MLEWLANLDLRTKLDVRLAEAEQEIARLKLALDAKLLECDLQGELIATYQQQVRNLLMTLVHNK